jgi:reverse gyrase
MREFTIEHSVLINGICPVCLGLRVFPRHDPKLPCPVCLGSGKMNFTEEILKKIREEILESFQDSSCFPEVSSHGR